MPGEKKTPLGNASITCALISLLLFPPLFALAAFILGIVGIAKEEGGKAIAGKILSVVCGFFGMIIGAAVEVFLFP